MPGVLCYPERGGGAGLGDRWYVFTCLVNWAWALNATVWVDPPCKMLSKAHNYGRPLDCGITWDRYFDVTPSHLFMNPANGPGCTLELPEYYNSFLSQLHNAFPSTASWPLPVGVNGPPGTEKPSVKRSSFAIEEASKLSKDMGLPREYDMIHIRRRDAKHECDTNVERMVNMLKRRTFATTHVVYATDERDPNYNNCLIQTLQNRNLTVHVPYSWLDGRFPRDNYMVYSIEQYLHENAAATHQWRRGVSCPSA